MALNPRQINEIAKIIDPTAFDLDSKASRAKIARLSRQGVANSKARRILLLLQEGKDGQE